LADEVVDQLLTVTVVTTLGEVGLLHVGVAAQRRRELEGPQEVVSLLELGADGEDFVDQILNADDVELAQSLGDNGVVSQGNTLLVDLAETALVDELADGLEVGGTVGDIGLNQQEHVVGGLVDFNEDTVVDLAQTQQLQDLLDLGGDVVDTADTDDEQQLGLRGNVERASVLGLAAAGS